MDPAMRLALALTAVVTAGLALTVGPAPASADDTPPVTILHAGYPSGPYIGYVEVSQSTNPDGTQVFGESSRIFVPPNTYSYVQGYTTNDCDPANVAFTSVVLHSDEFGRLQQRAADISVPTVPIEQVLSIAVRAAESTNKDVDGDGLFGPSDVIGIPGKPALGMWNRPGCDRSLQVIHQG